MKKLHQFVLGVAMAALANTAIAQAAPVATDAGAKDPFVDCRNEIAAAKADYDAKKISKKEYGEAKKKAKAKLKASGARSESTKNLECNN